MAESSMIWEQSVKEIISWSPSGRIESVCTTDQVQTQDLEKHY